MFRQDWALHGPGQVWSLQDIPKSYAQTLRENLQLMRYVQSIFVKFALHYI